MRVPVGLALVLAVAAAACSSVTARTGLPSSPCGPTAAQTLALSEHARVYSLRGGVYGCARGEDHSYRLGSASACMNSDRVGPVALAGTIAGYGVQRCGVDTGDAEIVVRRLTDGVIVRTAAATSTVPGPESYQSVASVVVKADGAVGWIGEARSIIGRGTVVQVRRRDTRGPAELDHGGGIAAGSLRLAGSLMSWRHSGRRRSAMLS